MPVLDDSVQFVSESSGPSEIPPAVRIPTSPNFAQLIQPVALSSMSSDLLRSRSYRILNFSIVLNDDTRTLISVHYMLFYILSEHHILKLYFTKNF